MNKHINHDKRWRTVVTTHYGSTCVVCGSREITIHHILTKGSHPEYRHMLENGVPLCFECHRAVHDGKFLLSQHIGERGSKIMLKMWLKKHGGTYIE